MKVKIKDLLLPSKFLLLLPLLLDVVPQRVVLLLDPELLGCQIVVPEILGKIQHSNGFGGKA